LARREERDVCKRKRLARREERDVCERKRLARRENGTVRELRAGGRGLLEKGMER
jgi:hypothetical protein